VPGAPVSLAVAVEPLDRAALVARYDRVRALTEALAEPLSPEDQVVQSMPDVSPTKWHRAHVTWFFETFVLAPHAPGYTPFHPAYRVLFNSYYEQVGPQHPRPERGLVSRPTAAEIGAYRAHVDEAVRRMAGVVDDATWAAVAALVELGLQHEQQHQELLLMDIKHVLSCNPLDPPYLAAEAAGAPAGPAAPVEHAYVAFDGGLVEIGHRGGGFAFDNEQPRHRVHLEPFRLANRLVTCGEWLEFVEAGGYGDPAPWLSDGWAAVREHGWTAPLYWRREPDGAWTVFTLRGRRAVDLAEPVSHVSHYEADAFARWAGARLPTEAEWEHAASAPRHHDGHTLSWAAPWGDALAPRPAAGHAAGGLHQVLGDAWEWTASAYLPYPGFRPPAGAIGEYNGKFMSGQVVLRGGCCLTPPGHARATYRNFFPPASRWAVAGVRLALEA
jgi:ergothioneine biosynthesis protein EgtB